MKILEGLIFRQGRWGLIGLVVFIGHLGSLNTLAAKQKSAVDPFLVITPPKSGTHLIKATLELMTQRSMVYVPADEAHKLSVESGTDTFLLSYIRNLWKKGACFHCHSLTPEQFELLEKSPWKVIIIQRDPRDQLISWFFYLLHIERNQAYRNITDHTICTLTKEYIFRSWDPAVWYASALFDFNITELEFIFRKQPQSNVCILRFEDLVGEKGGGTKERQLKALKKLQQFIHANVNDKQLRRIADNLFGNQRSDTFRKGHIGGWRAYFDQEMEEVFQERFGEFMQLLGYE